VTRQDGTIVTVSSGASGTYAPLTYVIQNQGNAAQGYTLSALNYGPTETNPFGGALPTRSTLRPIRSCEHGLRVRSRCNDDHRPCIRRDRNVQDRANTIPVGQANGTIAVVSLKAETTNRTPLP